METFIGVSTFGVSGGTSGFEGGVSGFGVSGKVGVVGVSGFDGGATGAGFWNKTTPVTIATTIIAIKGATIFFKNLPRLHFSIF
jgi:hypothetical protein